MPRPVRNLARTDSAKLDRVLAPDPHDTRRQVDNAQPDPHHR